MHPAIIIIPVAALALVPRLWVGRVLKRHQQHEASIGASAAELSRAWLDERELYAVRVEVTDIGDHYDPTDRAVRLTRDKHASNSLTAVTTAAHEVSHALQDAEAYPPFLWRQHLVRLAGFTAQLGTAILIVVPLAGMASRRSVSPLLIGSTLFTMLGSGMAAQLAALPTEFDASFRRALPMLKQTGMSEQELQAAKKILVACSLTYVANSLLSMANFWPWMRYRGALQLPLLPEPGRPAHIRHQPPVARRSGNRGHGHHGHGASHAPNGIGTRLIRGLGKPLIRTWFRLRPPEIVVRTCARPAPSRMHDGRHAG